MALYRVFFSFLLLNQISRVVGIVGDVIQHTQLTLENLFFFSFMYYDFKKIIIKDLGDPILDYKQNKKTEERGGQLLLRFNEGVARC